MINLQVHTKRPRRQEDFREMLSLQVHTKRPRQQEEEEELLGSTTRPPQRPRHHQEELSGSIILRTGLPRHQEEELSGSINLLTGPPSHQEEISGSTNLPIQPPGQQEKLLGSISVQLIILAAGSVFLLIAFILMLSTRGNCVHQVPEGHVGVYYRGGALMKTITNPGFHLKMPFITKFEPIQVTLRTNLVRGVPCGTSSAIVISFDKIAVVSRLKKEYVYDTLLNYGLHYDKTWIDEKIHDELNQFCSNKSLLHVYIDMFDKIAETMKEAIVRDCSEFAPGIEIMSVRVVKPNIPTAARMILEEERAKALAIKTTKVPTEKTDTRTCRHDDACMKLCHVVTNYVFKLIYTLVRKLSFE